MTNKENSKRKCFIL